MGHRIGWPTGVVAGVNVRLRCKVCGVCPSKDFQCALTRCPGAFVRQSAINYRTREGQRRARLRYEQPL